MIHISYTGITSLIHCGIRLLNMTFILEPTDLPNSIIVIKV